MKHACFHVRKCVLRGVEATEAASGHVFSRHTHDAFAIGTIVDGGQRSWSGRGTVEALRGDMISSNAGEVHDGSPIGGSRSWKMLYFSPELIFDLACDIRDGRSGEFEFTSPVFTRSPNVRAFELCYAAMTDDRSNEHCAESRMMMLLGGLLSAAKRAPPPCSEAVRRVRQRIDSDPAAPISLGEIASETGLSRYQALRSFTKFTGLTPHGYQVQRRIELARQLIRNRTSVSDAAAGSGFADQSHLHRMFVRGYGFTPGMYAASLR